MGQEGEGPHFDDNKPCNRLKDKSTFFLHFRISENSAEL